MKMKKPWEREKRMNEWNVYGVDHKKKGIWCEDLAQWWNTNVKYQPIKLVALDIYMFDGKNIGPKTEKRDEKKKGSKKEQRWGIYSINGKSIASL